MHRITISVTSEIDQAIKREARRRGCSVSEVAREALGNHLHLTIKSGQRRHIGFAAIGESNEPDIAQRVDEILAKDWGDPNFDSGD